MSLIPLRSVATCGGLVGGPFGSSLVSADYVDGGVPVIRGTNMGGSGQVDGDFVFVTEDKVARDLRRNVAIPGDLLFTQRGTLGQVAMVPDGLFEKYVVSQSQMRLRVEPLSYDARYVYFACTTPAFERQIKDAAITTGVPHINLGILGDLVIPQRCLREQRAIAEVLGALDDKIAANRQASLVIDALLKAAFQRSLSQGFSSVLLGEIARVNAVKVSPIVGGKLRYMDISSVSDGGYEPPVESDWNTAPGRARRGVTRGDTLWSTVRPNRRSHALVLECDPRLVASTGFAVLSPKSVSPAYLYQATSTEEFQAFLEGVAEGSAYPAVRASRFLEAPVRVCAERDQRRFDRVAMPARQMQHAYAIENERLAATRDALLPLLMSGKVRVKDVEDEIGELV